MTVVYIDELCSPYGREFTLALSIKIAKCAAFLHENCPLNNLFCEVPLLTLTLAISPQLLREGYSGSINICCIAVFEAIR